MNHENIDAIIFAIQNLHAPTSAGGGGIQLSDQLDPEKSLACVYDDKEVAQFVPLAYAIEKIRLDLS